MASAVKSRPNYYQVLGLGPSASADQIAHAFTKELSEPRPFGSLAEVTIAYETLRDPDKRKAYDTSLGLHPKPKPALSLAGRVEGAQFLDKKSPRLVDRLEAPRALRASPVPKQEARPQPRTAPSATALLHQPVTPARRESDATPRPMTAELRQPSSPKKPRPEPETSNALSRLFAERAHDAKHASMDWRLPAAVAGALVLAIGVGAWTGWEAGNDNDSVTVKVPSAKAHPRTIAPEPAEVASIAAFQPQPSAARPKARKNVTRPPFEITLPEKQEAEVTILEQKQRELEMEQAGAESAPVATAARMPLPNAVIARTIGRIGYPCGQVASTAAVEGAAGVFDVTCTSGHSYRASPLRGRYHFRRLAGR